MIGFWLIAGLVLIFGFVVLFGAPYLPTKRRQIELALDMLNAKKGQSLLELGAGDGRMVLAAAKRGLQVTAYELNPLLCLVIAIRAWRYRRQVKVICGNYWYTDWPKSDYIFVFLLDRYMSRLDKKVIQKRNQWRAPIKLASFVFRIPGRQAAAEKEAVYIYDY